MSRNFIPEQELIDQLLLDNTSAFEELFKRYWFQLYRYSYNKLQSENDAQKIVSGIFITLWQERNQLPVNFNISSYLYSEVRKSVIIFISQKLIGQKDTDIIEQIIIPSFNSQKIWEAATPSISMHKEQKNENFPIANKKRSAKGYWWKTHPYTLNTKQLRYAFQKVMHLF